MTSRRYRRAVPRTQTLRNKRSKRINRNNNTKKYGGG